MAYAPPAGNQVNFDFDDILTGAPNFNFRIFDVIPVKLHKVILKGVKIT